MTRLTLIPALAAAALTLSACTTTPTVEAPDEAATETVDEVVEEPTPEPEVGSRSNPAEIGSTIEDGDWAVTIDNVNLDATDVIAANEFNDPAAEGNVYILVTATVAYNGTVDEGEYYYGTMSYVTDDGKTIEQAWVDTSESGEDDFSMIDPMYPDTTHTGVSAFEVPSKTADKGTIVVTVDMGSDRKYVAVK